MELELKHLAPYLPYRLKAVKGVTRVDITAVSLDTNTTFIFHTTYLGSRRKEMSNIEKIKPILRPLSDLTKEIEVNGEKFTPLCRLTKQQFDKENESIFDDENLYLIEDDKYCYPNNGDKISYYWLSYNEKMQRFDSCDTIDLNQLKLLNKLFEWHFDVFGLIGQGLAVDINDLPN